MAKILTISISASFDNEEDFTTVNVDVELTGGINKRLLIDELAKKVQGIVEKNAAGTVKDITICW